MRKFMDDNFLLSTDTAITLYHEYAKNMPICDYHCHLNPKEIAEDKRYSNITEIWLGGDHYKWRTMRSFGIEEKYITGDASDYEKFQAFAKVMPYLIGNPMYHWSHLELKRYFGIEETLSPKTCESIWNRCNEIINSDNFSARAMIKKSNVKYIGTTDDPIDNLEYHIQISKDENFDCEVRPSFRPDKALKIQGEGFADYINLLGKTENIEKLLNTTLARLKGGLTNEYANIGADTIYNIVKGDFLSDEEKKAYIGLAFRLTSNDLNFLSDLLTKSGVYTKPTAKLTKFTNMKPYFKAVNFANFEDYVDKVGLPYYQKQNKASSIDDLKRASSLRVIEDYLRTSPKIAAVTNADELILNEKDIAFLKDVFKDRLVIYPRGGHCGNMFYKENVDVMVNFVNKGVLKYEN